MGDERKSTEEVLGKTSSFSKQKPKKEIVPFLLIGTFASVSDSFISLLWSLVFLIYKIKHLGLHDLKDLL